MINFLSHIMSVPFDIFYHDTTALNVKTGHVEKQCVIAELILRPLD